MAQSDADAVQAELQQVEAAVAQVASDLTTSSSALQAEIDKLAAANPTVNLDGVKAEADKLAAAVPALDDAAKAIGGLSPTPPPAGP